VTILIFVYVAIFCLFIFFLAIIDISHAPRVNKIHVCVGGSKVDSIIACIGMDAYEDTLKRKGAHPIMNDRLTKDYIDLDSEGRKDLREWIELAPRLNEELVRKKR
jgi:hypothetical protein